MKFNIHTTFTKIIADMLTPVSIYLRIREHFPGSIMLESSDYHGDEHNFSYICFDVLGECKVEDGFFKVAMPGYNSTTAVEEAPLTEQLNHLLAMFGNGDKRDLPFIHDGFFGYITYDCVQYFEDIQLRNSYTGIPLLYYRYFRYLLAFNHFNNELYLIEHHWDGAPAPANSVDGIFSLIKNTALPALTFSLEGKKETNLTDEQFLENVQKGISHCQRGDVFQIVLSRQFKQGFKGDDFQVYRTLRSVNPSPYLFYFDFGHFSIFGSSPEAQLIIKGDMVTIHPIAGTFRRTGDDKKDMELAEMLASDPKENAEHIMLVDLARNDLSRNGEHVQVEVYKEVQFYSHVIHLVSKVTSRIASGANKIKMIGDTFPAGTLSGAPKYKAMELIDQLEKTGRGFYGGAIGHLGLNGDFNHAIMIRSFLSEAHVLTCQAGAGVVVDSLPASELQEVENKLAALNKALVMAQSLDK